ncbi:MAG TPA: dTDP-4-dehydrorhamnose 3,5-epimerase [Terriglobales bacterium]|nr:dTDP-4-dehydrorhamnose 3,5-epimerase [Terriglobales bacterium]
MKFLPTSLAGACVIEIDPLTDERGFFARTWCREEFRRNGLNPGLAQCSLSVTTKKGTLRGLHIQRAPHEEAKIVRCTAGRIYDVIVDLRSASPTFKRWFALELTAAAHNMLYVPEGFAHGFQTLEDGCEVFYQMSCPYHAPSASGVRWDDPAFQISWPLPVSVISQADRSYPDFRG